MIVPLAAASLLFAAATDHDAEDDRLVQFRLLYGLGNPVVAYEALFAGRTKKELSKILNRMSKRLTTATNLDELLDIVNDFLAAITAANLLLKLGNRSMNLSSFLRLSPWRTQSEYSKFPWFGVDPEVNKRAFQWCSTTRRSSSSLLQFEDHVTPYPVPRPVGLWDYAPPFRLWSVLSLEAPDRVLVVPGSFERHYHTILERFTWPPAKIFHQDELAFVGKQNEDRGRPKVMD